MKKYSLLLVSILISSGTFAQTAVFDSVSMGAGYNQQIWYSMSNGEVHNDSSYNWDLMFTTNLMGSNAYTNAPNGVVLYQVPNTNISGFSTLDTTGYTYWQQLNNSDQTWFWGAFDQNTGAFPDFGWGTYNMTSHEVTGDSLYLVQLNNMGGPSDFKKLAIVKKTSTGDWIIHYSNLDNTGDVVDTILRNDYAGKNFSYYSLRNETQIDREPQTDNWDITFVRYAASAISYYPVTGVLNNIDVVAAQADNTFFNDADWANYSGSIDSSINVIGYDWKNWTGSAYEVTDSLVYFVKAKDGNIWKFEFTSYEGSASGKIVFMKEEVPVGISSIENSINSVSLYPNPSSGNSSLLIDAQKTQTVSFGITNSIGTLVNVQTVSVKEGLNFIPLETSQLSNGIYFIKDLSQTGSQAMKMVIAR